MEASRQDDWHPILDVMLDYFEGKLGDDAERHVEEHIARCSPCAALAREAHVFDHLWNWTARDEAAFFSRQALAHALVTAAEEAPSRLLRDRLLGWRARWKGCAEAAVGFVTRATKGAYEVVARGVDELSRPESTWKFVPVPAPLAVRGTEPEKRDSLVLTASAGSRRPLASIAIQAAEKSMVVVQVRGIPEDDPGPLVLLFSMELGKPPRCWVDEVRSVRGTDYRIAEFDEIPEGEYFVAFEPSGGSSAG